MTDLRDPPCCGDPAADRAAVVAAVSNELIDWQLGTEPLSRVAGRIVDAVDAARAAPAPGAPATARTPPEPTREPPALAGRCVSGPDRSGHAAGGPDATPAGGPVAPADRLDAAEVAALRMLARHGAEFWIPSRSFNALTADRLYRRGLFSRTPRAASTTAAAWTYHLTASGRRAIAGLTGGQRLVDPGPV